MMPLSPSCHVPCLFDVQDRALPGLRTLGRYRS